MELELEKRDDDAALKKKCLLYTVLAHHEYGRGRGRASLYVYVDVYVDIHACDAELRGCECEVQLTCAMEGDSDGRELCF